MDRQNKISLFKYHLDFILQVNYGEDISNSFSGLSPTNLLAKNVKKELLMANFGKDKLVSIKLSKEEQLHTLQHCELLPSRIYRRIKMATDGTLYLMEGDADILNASLCYTLQNIKNENIAAIFDRVINRIPLSSEIMEHLDRFSNQDCEDPKVSQKIWDEIKEEQRNVPDPRRGNLTPEHITRFMDFTWGDAEYPLQFNHNLSLKEVNQSTFFKNTRLFLKKLMEFKDEPTSTVKGNLNRKIVKLMFDEMVLDEEYREFKRKYHKVLNERDVYPLHIIKIVCEVAGLINNHSNKFLIPQKYQNLLSEEQAGELYYLLFETYYKDFDLSYLNRYSEIEGIRATIEFSFYRLSVICNDFQSVDDLYYEVFLPAVLEKIEDELHEYETEGRFVSSRILSPLVGFGLLECKYKQEKYFKSIDQARKTSLFDRFISLNL